MIGVFDSGVSGPGLSPSHAPAALCCVLGQDTNSHSASLHPGVYMGPGKLLGKSDKLWGSDL